MTGDPTRTGILGARLKIRNGQRHLDELKTLAYGYLKENPVRVRRIARSPGPGSDLVVEDEPPPVPETIALTGGDVVHNLRAALDVAVFPYTSEPERSEFPILKWKRGQDIAEHAELVTKKLPGAPGWLATVATALGAYKDGPGEDLVILNEIDIHDKHHVVPVVNFLSPGVKVNFGAMARSVLGRNDFPDVSDVLLAADPPPIRKGEVIFGNVPLDMDPLAFVPTVDLCFGEPDPVKAKRVIPTLERIASKVISAIDEIEKAKP